MPMILADTSIWADFLTRGDSTLSEFLRREMVVIHPFVIGEIALGNLPKRRTVLADLSALPQIGLPLVADVLTMVDAHDMGGAGIGLVDATLLAAVLLAPNARLWTRDRRLLAQARRLDVGLGDL